MELPVNKIILDEGSVFETIIPEPPFKWNEFTIGTFMAKSDWQLILRGWYFCLITVQDTKKELEILEQKYPAQIKLIKEMIEEHKSEQKT